MGVVHEPVDGGVGDGLGHEFVESGGMQVRGERDGASFVGGVDDAVERFGGFGGDGEHGCRAGQELRMYYTYVPNKTISVPDDVVPIIESLGVPFSRWVTDQLRRHAAPSAMSFAEQLLADAAQAGNQRPSPGDAVAAGERMERSAPW